MPSNTVVRTTVRLSGDLLRRAKKKAADEGRTLTSVLEEALRQLLANRQTSKARRKIRIPVSKARGGTLPGVDLNKSSELEDRMQGL
jgi:ribbon-helix-helix CopG family protein